MIDLLNLVKRVFAKKTLNVGNDVLVQQLSEKANGLFASFRKTHDELDDISNQLEQVIEAETQKKQQIERNIGRAVDEVQMNRKLQNKLADFIR